MARKSLRALQQPKIENINNDIYSLGSGRGRNDMSKSIKIIGNRFNYITYILYSVLCRRVLHP